MNDLRAKSRGVHRQRARRRAGTSRSPPTRRRSSSPRRRAPSARRAARSTAPAPCRRSTARSSRTSCSPPRPRRSPTATSRPTATSPSPPPTTPASTRRCSRRRTRGDLALAIALAFNSIGWKSQNILFNLVDSILGEPLIAGALDGEDPSLVSATITNSTIHAGGNVDVSADGAALLNATVSNAADSTASALFNAKGKAVGLAVAQNKVSSKALATIDGLGRHRRRRPRRARRATTPAIFSNIKIVSSSQTTNDGGTEVLQDEINNFIDGVNSSRATARRT